MVHFFCETGPGLQSDVPLPGQVARHLLLPTHLSRSERVGQCRGYHAALVRSFGAHVSRSHFTRSTPLYAVCARKDGSGRKALFQADHQDLSDRSCPAARK